MATPLVIQIKRATVTATPAVSSLASGELAYSYASNTLFIGSSTGSGAAVPIGGSGTFALINSPVFTGDPQAPTPPAADDDTSIATTEWVRDLSLSDFTGLVSGPIDLNNNLIQNVADPVAATDAANKGYVDGKLQGLDSKESVRLKTTANIDISSPGTVAANFDGVSPGIGDRILVTDQTDQTENGIYIYNGGGVAMTRAEDADTNAEVTANLYTFIEEGTSHADTGWTLVTNDPITLGSTNLQFTQFNGTGSINAGAGLGSVGNTINVGTADVSRIVVNANDIDLATTAVTPGTYIGFTVDAYGRVTGVTTPTTLAGYGITDAQPLDADLTAIAAITSTGILVRTGTNTYDTRTIAGTTNQIDVADGAGLIGNPTISISTTYPGQTSITTLGTIGTGTWQGDVVGLQYGGTNADLSSAGANCLIQTNAGGTALEATSIVDGGTF